MISVYEFETYRDYVKSLLKSLPKEGHGQSLKLSKYLNVHSTLVSQVFAGHKDFTLEQAAATAEFFGLNDEESEFFVLLVQKQRCGSEPLRKIINNQIKKKQLQSKQLVNRLKSNKKLKEEERAIFYSDWIYSGIRQATAIPRFNSPEIISEYFQIPIKTVKQVVSFLVDTGLCTFENDKLKIGPSSTHLGANSPWVKVHHVNWRNMAISKMHTHDEVKVHYTAPMTLSKADAMKIKEKIAIFLSEVDKIVEPSPSEEIFCLNIDLFGV